MNNELVAPYAKVHHCQGSQKQVAITKRRYYTPKKMTLYARGLEVSLEVALRVSTGPSPAGPAAALPIPTSHEAALECLATTVLVEIDKRWLLIQRLTQNENAQPRQNWISNSQVV